MGYKYIQIKEFMPAVKINPNPQSQQSKMGKNSLKNRELTQTEIKNIVNKLTKLLTKSQNSFEDLIVRASNDKEKINNEEFTTAMLKLDNKFDKSQLRGLFNKMDEGMLGDI